MRLRTTRLRESRFVAVWAERDQEEFELAQLRMAQPVGALREHLVRRPSKDQRELHADLALGPRSAYLATLSRLREVQRDGAAIAGRDVEVLSHHVDEVLAREPLKFCHLAIVSAPAHSTRTGT